MKQAEIFQTVATNFSEKDAKNTSKPIINSATQTRVTNTHVKRRMHKQKSNKESPTARELTKTTPAVKDIFVVSPNKNKQCPYIISQEDDDQ